MALANKDFNHSVESRERGIGPLEPGIMSTRWIAIFFVVFAFILYMSASWSRQHEPPRPEAPEVEAAPNAQPKSALSGPLLPEKQEPQRAAAPPSPQLDHQNHITSVSKCVANGITTYTDGPCAPGAKVTTVRASSLHNIADSVRVDPSPAPPPEVIAQAAPPSSQAESPLELKKLRCTHLDERIKWIDARARQPLSAGEQDWLAARRKDHRDEQFRIRC